MTDSAPDSLRLAWTGARGPFDSFVVQYWDADRQPQALLVGGDQDEVRVSGLEPSTPYKFFLYGLHHGRRLGPVSAEGTTGSARRARGGAGAQGKQGKNTRGRGEEAPGQQPWLCTSWGPSPSAAPPAQEGPGGGGGAAGPAPSLPAGTLLPHPSSHRSGQGRRLPGGRRGSQGRGCPSCPSPT